MILCLHHTAGNPNRPAKDDWETGKRFYNFIIDGKGALHTFKTAPNQRKCGKTYDLAFSGNFVTGEPRQAQIHNWNDFRDNSVYKFKEITTHGALAKKGCATASACPGRLLQFISLKNDNWQTKVNAVIREIAKREPMVKEQKYFAKRIHDKTIVDYQDLRTKVMFWMIHMPRPAFIMEILRNGIWDKN
jgi:hypothetical protein